MCDYSLHAVASRPAKVGETLITTMFPGTVTRGFASEMEPEVAVCMLRGTELAFEENIKHDRKVLTFWSKTMKFRVGKFGKANQHIPSYHHDAIEFPDGSWVLVTNLCMGQRVQVLQLPVDASKLDSHVHAAVPAATEYAR